jgi:hypothetical protein
VPLSFCRREEAVYIGGTGICGVIAYIRDVALTGRVNWPEERLAEAREHAERFAGERLV